MRDIPRINVCLYSAERVLILLADFEARNFDELFEGTFSANWQDFIHDRGTLIVEKVKVRNSKLSATGAIASVVKKAIYEKIHSTKDPDGINYPLYVYIKNDRVSILLDTTGPNALSKRGYRLKVSTAPLRETIAAGLIIVSDWDREKLLVDPFCGSGTICIEAARMALDLMNTKRGFAFQTWPIFKGSTTFDSTEQKKKKSEVVSLGFDKDPHAIKIARENSLRAEVNDNTKFLCKPLEKLGKFKNVHVVTNPPYGVRIRNSKENLHLTLKKLFDTFENSTVCLASPDGELEELFKTKASKKLRFQNSGIWTWFYIFNSN
ncbi:MAG: RNA methyltransferase [Pseudothermotoga sp.]|nr:RNA methyltransferase [Pseudothermotoga sp.]MDW8139379.1 RNA methyltransferase [Pseudothermotoga sp.]